MTYALERLAPGSYDVILAGEVVASLVADTDNRTMRTTWFAELLTDPPGKKRPAPFTRTAHKFDSLGAACEWLGVQRQA